MTDQAGTAAVPGAVPGGGALPAGPIRIVTGFAPGGPSDLLVRIVGEKLGERIGREVTIEGRVGHDGNVAARTVARSEPDGRTLLLGNNGIMAANMALYTAPGFSALADFAPLARIGTQPNILVVAAGLPVATVADLVGLARSKPGRIRFASTGPGAAAHLSTALFARHAAIDIVPVDYPGAAPALQDIVAGEVEMMFGTAASSVGLVKSGLLRALAVTTPDRSPALPEVPTMAELGFVGFDTTSWHGIVAPAGTPPATVEALGRAILEALADPGVLAKLTDLGVDVAPMGPAEFRAYVEQQNGKWAEIVALAGIRLD
jgi:tripartite-type tricarboxylate transporter receptor subunit TctC